MKIMTFVRRARKWSNYPRLAVPVTKGPLLGFYHFLTGYFVPLYLFRKRNPKVDLSVLDCGPMSKWFELLPGNPVETIDAAEGLQTALRASGQLGFARGKRVEVFTDWDQYNRFGRRPLKEFSEDIRSRFSTPESAGENRPLVLLVGRDHIPDELAHHPTRIFGAAKRNIPNMAHLRGELTGDFDVEILDGSALAPMETLSLCARASAVIGQHGAGLTNALFCPPTTRVVEILWDRGNKASNDHYKALCAVLGQPWSAHQLQEKPFSPVDPTAFGDLVRSLVPGGSSAVA